AAPRDRASRSRRSRRPACRSSDADKRRADGAPATDKWSGRGRRGASAGPDRNRWRASPPQPGPEPIIDRGKHLDAGEALVLGLDQRPGRGFGAGAIDHVAHLELVSVPLLAVSPIIS